MSRLVVSISHVEFTETDQTFYVVRVQQDADEWNVRRSYTDFRHLRDDVHRLLKDDKHQLVSDDASKVFARGFHELTFPPKRLFGSKKDAVVKERAVELHHFLIKLLFLTHTYRKAQKQRYDDPNASSVSSSLQPSTSAPSVHRPQGSASVFYVLRDFLKPAPAHTRSEYPHHGGRHSRPQPTDDNEEDDHARMIRESKMLNMRTSQQTKAMSAPQLMGNDNGNGNTNVQRSRATNSSNSNASTPRRSAPPPRPTASMSPEPVSTPAPHMDAPKEVHFDGPTVVVPVTKTKQRGASFAATASLSPSRSSRSSRSSRVSRVSKRFNDRISTTDNTAAYPVLHSISSDFDLITTTPDPQPRSLSTSSTASSTASFQARSLESASTLADATSTTSGTRRRPRSKKKSSSSSSLSRAEKEMRTSERLSRITPQLTVQAITIDAQKELEKYVSEYNAIMVMRYVDRFISKAVGKTPGCYTVVGRKILIDSARFVAELDDVFPDLPSEIQDAFKNNCGEWVFPKALDAYVQMKWNSFQGKSTSSLGGTFVGSSKASDSDDSDSDYEFEDTGAYMKKQDREFTQEVSDELQMMIAEGTAGRDQMLRLRRQFDEQGWHRRTNPGAKYQHRQSSRDSDTDEDDNDNDNGSGDESIKRFQAQQNAMRKSRMSHHDEGGLV